MATDNRTNEPTEAQVEAAAKAIFEEEKGQTLNGVFWPSWEDLCRCNLNDRMCTHGGKQLPYVLLARAALVAAQGAAPVLPSSGVDEDALARLLCEKNYVSPDGKPTCAACRDKAHEVAAWLKVQGGESRGE